MEAPSSSVLLPAHQSSHQSCASVLLPLWFSLAPHSLSSSLSRPHSSVLSLSLSRLFRPATVDDALNGCDPVVPATVGLRAPATCCSCSGYALAEPLEMGFCGFQPFLAFAIALAKTIGDALNPFKRDAENELHGGRGDRGRDRDEGKEGTEGRISTKMRRTVVVRTGDCRKALQRASTIGDGGEKHSKPQHLPLALLLTFPRISSASSPLISTDLHATSSVYEFDLR